MLPQLLAISAAALKALNVVVAKKGLARTKPLPGLFVSNLVLATGIWILAFQTIATTRISLNVVLLFAADGLLSVGFGSLLYYFAIERVGASITASVSGSQSLFFALFAVFFSGKG